MTREKEFLVELKNLLVKYGVNISVYQQDHFRHVIEIDAIDFNVEIDELNDVTLDKLLDADGE